VPLGNQPGGTCNSVTQRLGWLLDDPTVRLNLPRSTVAYYAGAALDSLKNTEKLAKTERTVVFHSVNYSRVNFHPQQYVASGGNFYWDELFSS